MRRAYHGLRRLDGLNASLLTFLCAFCSGCVFITGDFNPLSTRPQPLEEHVVAGSGKAKIVMLDIANTITSEESEGALGINKEESTVARVEAVLQQAGEDDDVCALVVRINSPGGTVTASDIVYEQLRRFRNEHHVPVIAQLMDMAASGGYYSALAADEIVANPTTVTGSIGVVFYGVSFEGLMDKIGVRNQTVRTGSMKDIGSPLRTMTPEEKKVLQTLLDQMFARFIGLVRSRRPKLTPEGEARISDGRVLSAEQALDLGLIDRIAYLEDTLSRAKTLAKVPEASVVMYRRPDEFSDTIYARAPTAQQINLLNVNLHPLLQSPQFLYMWLPQGG